jgi:hypothetical protein
MGRLLRTHRYSGKDLSYAGNSFVFSDLGDIILIYLIIYCFVFQTNTMSTTDNSYDTAHILTFCVRRLYNLMPVQVSHFHDNFVHLSSAILCRCIFISLDALATELQKCACNLRPVRLSVCMLQIDNFWTDFDDILYSGILLKFVNTFQSWFKSDSNGHFKWRPTRVCARPIIYQIRVVGTQFDNILYLKSLVIHPSCFAVFIREHRKLTFTKWKYTDNKRANALELLR